MSKRFYLLDPGHGEETPGKRSPKWDDMAQLFEWEFNRDVAARLRRLCMREGISCNILVPEDSDVSLQERCRRANDFHASKGNAVVISIHANAFGSGEAHHPARGFEVFTTPGATRSDDLATAIFRAAQAVVPDWGYRQDVRDGDPDKEENFYILRNTRCPAVLTENGFMTNRDDCRRLLTPEFREKVAQYHLNGILAFEKLL